MTFLTLPSTAKGKKPIAEILAGCDRGTAIRVLQLIEESKPINQPRETQIRPPFDMQLQTSPDGHFFQYSDGRPFYYLADTAWMLPNKLTEHEARRLFVDRAAKGFTVIQSLVFRDLFETNSPKADGVRPFATDADMRGVRLNPEWIEWIVTLTRTAAEYELTMGWLPTWGDKWNEHSNSAGPVIMNADSAREYCRVLSDALGDCENVIWIVGGDSPLKTKAHADIVRAMAEGIRAGRSSKGLISYHASGGRSSTVFHQEAWLDFNAQQSGHGALNTPNYKVIEDFYQQPPAKPCLDMEPNYEGMPVAFTLQDPIEPAKRAYFSDYDVRRAMYRSVLAGAAGFSYGHDAIRQVYRPGDRSHASDGRGTPTWDRALSAPGSSQVKLLKEVLLERSYFTRRPAREVILKSAGDDVLARCGAARCSEGSYLYIYIPMRQMLEIDTSTMPAKRLRITVYDPAAGAVFHQWECENTGHISYIPALQLDSFVVIDAAK